AESAGRVRRKPFDDGELNERAERFTVAKEPGFRHDDGFDERLPLDIRRTRPIPVRPCIVKVARSLTLRYSSSESRLADRRYVESHRILQQSIEVAKGVHASLAPSN